jgi:AAA ATPase domain
MPLVSFTVGGFQSYREPQPITIDPDVTLVAGRNNVGKSALLRALRVFVEKQEGTHDDFHVSYTWSFTPDELLELTLAPGETAAEYEEWAKQRDRHELMATYRRRPEIEGAVVEAAQLYLYGLELPAEGKRATGGPESPALAWDAGEWAGAAYLQMLARAPTELVRRVKFVGPRRIESGLRALNPVPELQPDAANLMDVVLYLDMNSKMRKFRELTTFMVSAFPEIQAITVMRAGSKGPQRLRPCRSLWETRDEMLASQDDRSLFGRPPPAGTDPVESVRASEVLRRLYWDMSAGDYDKVSDGKRLAELAVQYKQELLDPLREIVASLTGDE